MMGFKNNYSPLRYPGGKAAISGFFESLLVANEVDKNGVYCEPFAGGAGVALTLLLSKKVSKIVINDYDICIASFWEMVLDNSLELISRIEQCNISIEDWRKQREIYDNASLLDLSKRENKLALGFATFYLNRCNRAGILPNAGPIGGQAQTGKYKIDARFKKNKLIDRIKKISEFRNQIIFSSMDALDFLDALPTLTGSEKKRTFLYLDPPYYQKGNKLYLNFYNHENHIALAEKMLEFDICPWMMTYDDCSEIRNMYGSAKNICIENLSIQYSMQKVRKSSEILIFPRQTKGVLE